LTTADGRHWRKSVLVAAGIFAAVHIFDLLFPGVIAVWNERLNDQLLRLKTSRTEFRPAYDDAIVHVDLNNTSLRALRDYHPGRSHHARVIRNLGRMKVAVQLYDFIFAGTTNDPSDRDIMEAARQAENVLVGMAFRLTADSDRRQPVAEDPEIRTYLDKSKWTIRAADADSNLYFAIDPLVTLVGIAEQTRGTGFLTLTPDPDGVIRRIPLLARYEGGYFPSFVLKAVCEFLKVSADRIALKPGMIILQDAERPDAPGRKDIVIPVDDRGCMRINYVGPWGAMKHYNFSDIYLASDDPERLELWEDELSGKLVLVSDISTGSADMGQVPIDELFPLSGVHANSVHTILSGGFFQEVSKIKTTLIEILLLIAVTALSFHRSVLAFSLATVGLGGVFFAIAGFSLLSANLLIPVVRPLLILFMGWSGLLMLNAVEEARARARTEKAKEIAERELEIGRKIQIGFLPARLPVPPGWEIAAHFQPALQVSGDFYDVFELAGGRCLGIVIADVCDHGVGSALFMALTRSLIRAFALQSADRLGADSSDPSGWSRLLALDTVRQTNAYIADNHGEAGMFATLFLGILDPVTGSLTYVNAGHEPPLFLRSGHPAAYLKATGLAVGALPDAPYRTESIRLEPGNCLILYTDGVTDADDRAGVHFSKQRLVSLVLEDAAGAQGLVDSVIAALEAHVGKGSPADDVTLLAIRKIPANTAG
jgi:serine phosphatase RsbU (regulator of sigma subunit)/CHASE2 domain-containing sensor protein